MSAKKIPQRVLAAAVLAGFSVPLTAAAQPAHAQNNDQPAVEPQHTDAETLDSQPAEDAPTNQEAPAPEPEEFVAPAEDTEPLAAPEPVAQPEPVTEDQPAPAAEPAPQPVEVASVESQPAPAAEPKPVEPSQEPDVQHEPATASVKADAEEDSQNPEPVSKARTAGTQQEEPDQQEDSDDNDEPDVPGDDGISEGPEAGGETDDGEDGEDQDDTTEEGENVDDEPESPRTDVPLPGGGNVIVDNQFTETDGSGWTLGITVGQDSEVDQSNLEVLDANGNPVAFSLNGEDGNYQIEIDSLETEVAHIVHFGNNGERTSMIVGAGDVPSQAVSGNIGSKVNSKDATVLLSGLARGIEYTATYGDTQITVQVDDQGNAVIDLNDLPNFDKESVLIGNLTVSNNLGLHNSAGSSEIKFAYAPPETEKPDPDPDPDPEKPTEPDPDPDPEPGDGDGDGNGGDGNGNDGDDGDDGDGDGGDGGTTGPGSGDGDGDTEPGGGGEEGSDPDLGDQDGGSGGGNEGGEDNIELPSNGNEGADASGDNSAAAGSGDDDSGEEPGDTPSPSEDSNIDAFGDLQTAIDADVSSGQSDELPLASAGADTDLLDSASSESLLSRLQNRDNDDKDETDDSELDVFNATAEPLDDSDDLSAKDKGPERVNASSSWMTGLMIALGSGIITLFAWLVFGKKRRGEHANEA